MIPFVDTQNMEQVPATSTACPGSILPLPIMDCIVSPAPPQIGIPAGSPVSCAISSVKCPIISHGFTIRGIISSGIPRMSSCSFDQHFSSTLYPSPHPDIVPQSTNISFAESPARCANTYGASWINFAPFSLKPSIFFRNQRANIAGNIQFASGLPVSFPKISNSQLFTSSTSSFVRESR